MLAEITSAPMTELHVAFARSPWSNAETQLHLDRFLHQFCVDGVRRWGGDKRPPCLVRSWGDLATSCPSPWVMYLPRPGQVLRKFKDKAIRGRLDDHRAVDAFFTRMAEQSAWAMFAWGVPSASMIAFVSLDEEWMARFESAAQTTSAAPVSSSLLSSYRVDQGGIARQAQAVLGSNFGALVSRSGFFAQSSLCAVLASNSLGGGEFRVGGGCEVIEVLPDPRDVSQLGTAHLVSVGSEAELSHVLRFLTYELFDCVVLPESETEPGRLRRILSRLRGVNDGLDITLLRESLSEEGWLIWARAGGEDPAGEMVVAHQKKWLRQLLEMRERRDHGEHEAELWTFF